MQTPAYDRADGIQAMLSSLSGLNSLVNQRREAGYGRRERLHQFVILGRWQADSCGNFGRAMMGGRAPKNRFPDIPDVLTFEEFWTFLRSKNLAAEGTSVMTDLTGSHVPPANIICPECQRGWTIDNCHDTVVVHTTEDVPLEKFVGQKLSDAQQVIGDRTDSIWRMQDDILIRNDRRIDLSPKPGYETLKVNERGWVGTRDGIAPDYVIEPGDDGFFNVWRFYHGTCNRTKLDRAERERFTGIFVKAGFDDIALEAIPNQYCPCDVCAPWYRVTTAIGVFTIGWRERVINIDWSALGQDFLSLFEGEDVTKGANSIHAWGWEKATDYLSRIRQSLAPIS
ncbi:MAG: hypothetical protein A3B31_01755 [Candidatus Komeilibacteria bacterium RIFCSPLOWO2_01_FULL_53_11]|uniref:Uncharacterized protein n=1 Tax=Candidatus Komeilibacteria bacterium RIFCSPLOWO2_01_FULL_53_11 TaxID=1798552 RepID=A0A1G2BU23_9BACT|nr:MAG: hypothetical protein A3B31_01755 [Candidatus Komeilibacteria bacterium RIFCSPLOWO2_01_FULL_53_11]